VILPVVIEWEAEKDIWAKEGGSNRRLEKIA
jgi:hypothetical protein